MAKVRRPKRDLTGLKFGQLTVTGIARRGVVAGKSAIFWGAVCDCSAATEVITNSLTSGNTRSCGCLISKGGEKRATHGMSYTATYAAWAAAKARCTNRDHPSWDDYGGRGISMCESWMTSFEAFFAHMGHVPAGLELDRIENDGDYEPGNCRWTDRVTQIGNQRTKRTARLVEHNGRTLSFAAFGRAVGMNPSQIRTAMKRTGLPPVQAVASIKRRKPR